MGKQLYTFVITLPGGIREFSVAYSWCTSVPSWATRHLDGFLLLSTSESVDIGVGDGRRALGAFVFIGSAQQLGGCAMDDVFTLTRSVDESGSRVVRVLATKLPVRLRSKFVWAHLHWAQQSILCAGGDCPACVQGYTRRRYAFVGVDKPGLAQGVLQLTEHDVCLLAKLAKCEPESMMIGLQFRVWRSKSRQPLEAEFLGFTEELFAIPTETLMVDVLRIHGVRATEKDVSTGGFRSLIAGRTRELIGNARATA